MIQVQCGQLALLQSPKRLGGSQGMAASSPVILHSSFEPPSFHHTRQHQHHNQLHPLNLSKCPKWGRKILGIQRDLGH